MSPPPSLPAWGCFEPTCPGCPPVLSKGMHNSLPADFHGQDQGLFVAFCNNNRGPSRQDSSPFRRFLRSSARAWILLRIRNRSGGVNPYVGKASDLKVTRVLKPCLATVFSVLLATTVMAAPTPKAPTNLAATAASSSQINLSWIDQSTNETGFAVERATSTAGPWSQVGTVGANIRNFSSTGLAGSTTYYFRVMATSATAGNSGYSNIAAAATQAAPILTPTPPSGLAASAASSSQINLAWTDNSTNETGFKIERATSSGGPWTQVVTTGANTVSYPIYSLTASTTYYFRVRATSGSGDSAYSAVASATTLAAPPAWPDSAPTNVVATMVSSSQIRVTWTDTCTNETSYVVERTTGTAAYAQIASLPANYTSYTDSGLAAGTTYTYRVSTQNGGGARYASPVSATTQTVAPTLPAAPSGLTTSVASSSQINLGWTDNSSNETGFYVERATSTGGPWSTIATTGSNATGYSATGLAASTTYYFRVRAFNGTGSSAYTATVSATTTAAAALPAAPTGLSVTPISASQINPSRTDNPTNEQGFSVERASTASGPWSVDGTTAMTTYSDTGLTAGTTYYYRVRAYNATGNSGYTSTMSGQTPVVSGDTI